MESASRLCRSGPALCPSSAVTHHTGPRIWVGLCYRIRLASPATHRATSSDGTLGFAHCSIASAGASSDRSGGLLYGSRTCTIRADPRNARPAVRPLVLGGVRGSRGRDCQVLADRSGDSWHYVGVIHEVGGTV